MNVTKQLYQWDTGQKLTECTGIYVDYLIGDEVYRVEITDGTCIIPDELLQTSGRYKVWECMADNTLREFAFKVLPRPIPPNYVFTPTEQLTFEGLVQKETDKFNTNAIEKLNAYNANADNRVAEFNAQTEQIQADVSELKSDIVDLDSTIEKSLGDYYLKSILQPIQESQYADANCIVNKYSDSSIKVVGTTAGSLNVFVYNDSGNLPNGMEVGGTYDFVMTSEQNNASLQIYEIRSNGNPYLLLNANCGTYRVTIPQSAVGLWIRYRFENGIVLNDTYKLSVFKTVSITDKIETLENEIGMVHSGYALLNAIPKKKILTWVDDDTTYKISEVKTVCDELGIKCTFAHIPSLTTDSVLELLKSYQLEGFNIANHSYSHSRWYSTSQGTIFTRYEMENDLMKAIESMNNNGFVDGGQYFVYPGDSGDRDDAIKAVSKWCKYAVKAGGGGINNMHGNGRYSINRQFIDASQHSEASYYTNILDSTNIENNPWVVFGTHSGGGSSQWNPTLVQSVLQYALDNGWEIMTLNEALKFRERFYAIQDMYSLPNYTD